MCVLIQNLSTEAGIVLEMRSRTRRVILWIVKVHKTDISTLYEKNKKKKEKKKIKKGRETGERYSV